MEPIIYLDHAATTRVRPEVCASMDPFVSGEKFGNPSSPHRFGRAARAAVESARRQVATALQTQPGDVVFTSGGTEANNLAVIGGALSAQKRGKPFRIAVGATEHKAVIEAARAIEPRGGEVIVLDVDRNGAIDLHALDEALARGLALVSVMWVNNEIGVVQDIASIARRCHAASTWFHTDAVQAVGKVPCELAQLPPMLVTISGHKLGALKGVGALITSNRDALEPLLYGGGQQHGIRPGTENVAGIVGLGTAVERAVHELPSSAQHMRLLRDELEQRLCDLITQAIVVARSGHRAPHISNMLFPGTDSDSLLMHLDLAGVCCSSGSACSTGAVEPSAVHLALGIPVDEAISAVRFSLCHSTTRSDIDRVVEVMPGIVERVRELTGTLADE